MTGNNQEEKDQVLATVAGFLDSISDAKTPLTEAAKFVLPSAYAVDWRAHAGELLQTPPNEYVAEMERRLDRMYAAGMGSFAQALAVPTADNDEHHPPRVWVDAGQGIAAVWARFVMKSDGEEKYRGVGAFTLYYRPQQQQQQKTGGENGSGNGPWKIAAFVDTRWDPEYFRPRPMEDAQATEELLAAARTVMDLLHAGEGEDSTAAAAALGDAVLPGCITHRLDNSKSGGLLQSLLFRDLFTTTTTEEYKDAATRQQQQHQHQRRKAEVLDGEGRVVAGVGFLWMRYTVMVIPKEDGNDGQTIEGTATLTFLQKNGKWLVSGVQQAERLPS